MTKGPAWEELERLGLNVPRDDSIEEAKRCGAKWAYSHASDAEDADEREASATYSLVVLTLPKVLPLAERGVIVGKAASEGGTARSGSFDEERQRWRDTAAVIRHERRRRPPSKLELAKLVARRLYPHKSPKDIKQLAEPVSCRH
jgi:hypothetical protein